MIDSVERWSSPTLFDRYTIDDIDYRITAKMALSSSGQMHQPIANSRSFRKLAALLSSVSSQFFSTGVGLPEHLPGKNFGAEEFVGSSSFSNLNSSEFARRIHHDESNSNDVRAIGPCEGRSSSLLSPCVSGAVVDASIPLPGVCHGWSLSTSWGLKRYTQASWGFLWEPGWQTNQGRLHVRDLPTIRIWQSPRRSHMGHHHHHQGGPDKSGKEGERVLGWGLWGDISLAIGKGGAGYVSGSTALIADAAHSVSDIALSGVALWTSRVAHTPKDKQHPYGHGKFESIGALGISGILLLTGGGIAWHALEALQPFIPMMSEWVQTTTGHHHEHINGEGHHHGIDLQHPYVALAAAIFSIGVKEMLYWRTKGVGEEQNSELLKASAWHHRSDAVSSIVALVGVGGAMLGLPLLDPVAGIVVSGMIMKAGFETGHESLQVLVDSGVQESVLSPIRNTVLHVQGVKGCHHLRGRRMGSFIHVDAHLEVDPWLSVSAAHNIGEAVRHQIQNQHPEVAETFVHIEPADGGTKTLTHDEAEFEHRHHDHTGGSHNHEHELSSHLNEHSFNKKDLTKEGSKSDLMKSSRLEEECAGDNFENEMRQHPDVEEDVRHVMGAKFHEKMSINHVTSHFLQGKVVVEVEVSMNPDISVRSAMDYASNAEQAILQRVSDISAVRVQLKLSKGLSQST